MKLIISLTNSARLIIQIISPKTYFNISNWRQYFKDYLGLIQKDYPLIFRNKFKIIQKVSANTKWQIYEIIFQDTYQLHSFKKNPPKTIIDLGANIGVTSIFAKSLFPKSKIFSFEPDKTCFPYLIRNIQLNNFQSNIHAFPLACYSQKTAKELEKKKPKTSQLVGPKWIFSYKNTTTLQEIFKKNKVKTCDLLKIDIEAAEYNILYSLPKQLFSRIKNIHVEYHNINSKNLNGNSLKKHLENNNYQVKQRKSLLSNIGMLYAAQKYS